MSGDSEAAARLATLGAAEAVAAMRAGALSAARYADALLERARSAAHLNAFLSLDVDAVRSAAHAADRRRAAGRALGALHGLPVPVKDSLNTVQLPTTQGTRALQYLRPRRDAGVLARLWSAGALLMGKTALHELSRGWTCNNGAYGAVRNPHDPARIPGGSSGGSAVAVAAGMAPLAVGEDTLGSIRVPASLCGVAGFRPSPRRYPGDGVLPLTFGRFDEVGPLARRVEDLALFDAAVTGDARPLPRSSLMGLRIGLPQPLLEGLDPEIARVMHAALAQLAVAGAVPVPIATPPLVAEGRALARTILAAENVACMERYLAEHAPGVGFADVYRQMSPNLKGLYAAASVNDTAQAHADAVARLAQFRAAVTTWLRGAGVAVLAFPPALTAALPLGDNAEVRVAGTSLPIGTVMGRNTALGSCAGLPSLVLPAGYTRAGLPVGLEFAGAPGEDRRLLGLGLALEAALTGGGSGAAPWETHA